MIQYNGHLYRRAADRTIYKDRWVQQPEGPRWENITIVRRGQRLWVVEYSFGGQPPYRLERFPTLQAAIAHYTDIGIQDVSRIQRPPAR